VRATFTRGFRKKKPEWEHETGATRAFLWALFIGGDLSPVHENRNEVDDVSEFDDESLKLVVDEGRLQAARQGERFRHATDRGQLLLTVDLALLGFLAALLHHLVQLHGDRKCIALGVWAVSALLTVIGTAAAAAVVVVKATFGGVDTTNMTTWSPPILRKLALDYAEAVIIGELTADLRVTVFRRATRITVWGAVLAAFAFGLSA
jgi:hypothetical protein